MQADAQFWDNLAERYARQPLTDVPAYEAKLRATKARLTPQDVVLDLGCGTGSLALELAPRVAHVHSVDVSGEMIRIGEGKARAAGVDNITFHQAPVDALPVFEPQSFGMVCAYNILHLVHDWPGVLTEIMGLLRPGGHFVSSTPCLGESLVPYGLAITVMRLFGKAPEIVHSLRVEDLVGAMEQAGFVEITREKVSKDPKSGFLLARKRG